MTKMLETRQVAAYRKIVVVPAAPFLRRLVCTANGSPLICTGEDYEAGRTKCGHILQKQ